VAACRGADRPADAVGRGVAGRKNHTLIAAETALAAMVPVPHRVLQVQAEDQQWARA